MGANGVRQLGGKEGGCAGRIREVSQPSHLLHPCYHLDAIYVYLAPCCDGGVHRSAYALVYMDRVQSKIFVRDVMDARLPSDRQLGRWCFVVALLYKLASGHMCISVTK